MPPNIADYDSLAWMSFCDEVDPPLAEVNFAVPRELPWPIRAREFSVVPELLHCCFALGRALPAIARSELSGIPGVHPSVEFKKVVHHELELRMCDGVSGEN
jgi:hypothetical protein